MANNALTVIFPVGTKVRVKEEYQDGDSRRSQPAVVISHKIVENRYVDNWLEFSDGYTAPFGNWELEEE